MAKKNRRHKKVRRRIATEKTRAAPSSQRVSTRGFQVLVVAVVCTLVLIAHWPVLSAQAHCFDDNQYLFDNLLIQNPGWTSAKLFLTEVLEPSTVQGYYQPLAMISLMADYALGGRSDYLRPFHRTSLGLHVANTALVIVLLYLLFGRIWIAAAVGLLFGLHPMTIEPIAWVSDRKTLLAAFFSLLSLISYVRFTHNARWKFYGTSMAMYILALMSKPTSIALPAVMLLIDYWPSHKLKTRGVLQKIPLFAIGALFALIAYLSQSRTAAVRLPGEFGPLRIVLTVCHNIIFYPWKVLWPADICPHYAFPDPMTLAQPMVLAGLIGTIVLICALLVSLRWTRAPMTSWLIFFVAILPTMQIVRFSDVIASDKFAYLPSIGLLMAAAAFLKWITGAVKNKTQILILPALVLILAAALATPTRRQLNRWRETTALLEHMVLLSPNALNVHNMLGSTLLAEGRTAKAMEHYHRALELDPTRADVAYNLANAYKDQGRIEEAINLYRRILQAEPDNIEVLNNLGIALISSNDLPAAIKHFEVAVAAKPTNLQSRYNLATALTSNGRLDDAVEQYRLCLKHSPDFAKAHNGLGLLLVRQKRLDDALPHFNVAIEKDPDWIEPLNAAAKILSIHPDGSKRDVAKAIKLAQRATRLTNYQDPLILITLADAYAAQGRYDDAITTAQKALDLPVTAANEGLTARLRQRIAVYKRSKPDSQGEKD